MTSPHRPTQTVDVAIIGGGIAGSSLAIVLRRAGLEVALIEREATFRDRIRGEAIHPWGVAEVHALGLREVLDEAGAISLPYWTRYRNAEPGEPYAWASDFPDSPGGISANHVAMQETLIHQAREEGAQVFQPATAQPVASPDGWQLAITSEDATTLHARLLVGADGQRSLTRKVIGGTGKRDPIHHSMGGMLVRGVDLARDSAHQAYHEAGFGMVYLQQDDLSRVYYVCPTEEARELQGPQRKDEYLRRVGALYPAGAFDRAEPVGPLGFFPNSDLVSSRIDGPNAVLIGDAAGANDPSQGHGLALVYRDIRVLRDLLATTDWREVPATFGKARRGYYGILREHAKWVAPLVTETGEEADALRAQVERARAKDPTAGGFAGIFATGPSDQRIDAAAKAKFLGKDLRGNDH